MQKARTMSAREVFHRARAKLRSFVRRRLDIRRDIRNGTYLADVEAPKGRLLRLIGRVEPGRWAGTLPAEVIERYLDHQFNLLGSGWVKAEYGAHCAGFGGTRYRMSPAVTADPEGTWLRGQVNRSNLAASRRIWASIKQPYQPIDWQLDLRSGYRWSPVTPSAAIKISPRFGSDVKGPWELARMQHLPQIALACAQVGADPDSSARYAREFRNEVADFLATNPPRFGVNWSCTMDVAIRLANWLIAWDLFQARGVTFDISFEDEFLRGVYEHCLHIVHHLEWDEDLRGNHYLADITGLLFGACYLPQTPQVDTWLALSVQELIAAVAEQFHEDGSSFEASTSYHRLSAEMVAFATALVLGLPAEKKQALVAYDHRLWGEGPPKLTPGPAPLFPSGADGTETPFPSWYVERVRRMALFTAGITRDDGQVPQIGDNDNARFVKAAPAPDEWTNDHRHLVRAIGALFQTPDGGPLQSAQTPETWILHRLSGGACLAQPRYESPSRADVSPSVWKDFGLYVFRTEEAYLAVRCGPIGEKSPGGHAHNDQLSFELAVHSRPVLGDPGTYTYTPDLTQRNRFRSTAMHNTAGVRGVEQNLWPAGLPGAFRMIDRAGARVTEIGPGLFRGTCRGGTREIRLSPGRLCGVDRIEGDGEKWISFHFVPGFRAVPGEPGKAGIELAADDLTIRLSGGPGVWVCQEDLYSPSYGIVRPAWTVRLVTSAAEVQWEVSWRLTK